MEIVSALAEEFRLRRTQVENVIGLIDEGCTIPFIARYRKERTGSLDDQVLRELGERLAALRGLEKRRGEVRKTIEEQGKWSDALARALEAASTLAEIEDIYLPYRPKRRTRASIAREKGLEPLAAFLAKQEAGRAAAEREAERFVNREKGVETAGDALSGAMDILAEQIADDAALRRELRALVERGGVLHTKAAKKEDSVYRGYYDYAEAAAKMPGHRVLAIDRGEREGFLSVSLELEEQGPLAAVARRTVKSGAYAAQLVRRAGEDAWRRLLFPALERELRSALTERAQEQAIHVFAQNLRPLLLQPPVKGKTVLGLDPAYRTGCKVAVVDPTGKVLDTAVVYPTPPQSKTAEAKAVLKTLIARHGVEVISIGNGTASRETELFAAELIRELPRPVSYMVVSEAGASVYSASKLGAEEFPQYDVSLRSAVSIARRLQDPLAELIKIDPKAIGVGQYQHDLKPARLDEALGGVVEDCVNTVGADLNTASAPLLSHISGIGPAVARNIVSYREENGAFASRRELLHVPKLGPKAYEQCAGFLRILGGASVLDNTSVHPESYGAAGELLTQCGFSLTDVASGRLASLPQKLADMGEQEAARRAGVGLPTLRDIVSELMRPGRDPRDELPRPLLRTDVLSLSDLKPGMELTGTVRNVVDFGAFIDIGVHQDGLLHISQIGGRFLRHPSEALTVGDIVKVRVLSVDAAQKRISLTMRTDAAPTLKS